MPHSKFLTVSEAAEYLRVSVSSIYNWKSQGRLKGRKHGTRLLFTLEELDSFDESKPVLTAMGSFHCPGKSGIQAVPSKRKGSLKSKYVLEGHLKEKKDGL